MMMSRDHNRPVQGRRWYDRIESVADAIDLTRHLPGYVQDTIVAVLDDTIEHYSRLRKNHQQSMGVSKVLGLYQASKRARWYDPKPSLRRTLNMMAVIPAEPLQVFAEQIIVIGHMLNIEQAEKMLPNRIQVEQQVEALLKKTYFTFVEDPRGIRVVQNDWSGDPDEEIREGRIIVPARKQN